MSGTDSQGRPDQQRTIQIPALMTASLRAVLDAFRDDIIQLSAHGSVETNNTTSIEGLRQYAVSREQQTNHRIGIDYEQLAGADGPANPLDAEARESILSEVEAVIGSDDLSVQADLTVTSLTVRLTDERLQEVTPAQSPEFDLRFVADAAEPPVRDPTKRRNADRGLYDELGFKITNLNLRTVVETQTKYHQQSDGRYLSWRGPGDIRPRVPDRLAIRINEHHLPDRYGLLKPYVVAEDRVLEISESDLDTVEDGTPAGSALGDEA